MNWLITPRRRLLTNHAQVSEAIGSLCMIMGLAPRVGWAAYDVPITVRNLLLYFFNVFYFLYIYCRKFDSYIYYLWRLAVQFTVFCLIYFVKIETSRSRDIRNSIFHRSGGYQQRKLESTVKQWKSITLHLNDQLLTLKIFANTVASL